MTPWTVAHQAPLSMGFPSKNIGVGCHFFLQGIFPRQRSNLGLLYYRWILYQLSYEGSPPSDQSKSHMNLSWTGGGGGLVAKSCPTLVTLWTVAHQAPLSMGFSRQEYWSGWPFPSPGNLPYPGIKPRSPVLQADSLLTELQGKTL